jgi:hypothetical protein
MLGNGRGNAVVVLLELDRIVSLSVSWGAGLVENKAENDFELCEGTRGMIRPAAHGFGDGIFVSGGLQSQY